MVKQIFIASTYSDNRIVREELATTLWNAGYNVAIAETTNNTEGFIHARGFQTQNVVEVSDSCLKELSESDLVICLLSGSLGSRILSRETLFRAKHFELELFS